MSAPGGLVLDPRTRLLDGGRMLLGGDPWRVLRLTDDGAAVLRRLLAEEADDEAGKALARRLIDAGLAHPAPRRGRTGEVTVVIPVRDRPVELERCLTALMASEPPGRVIVVDDGSREREAVAAVCARHACELIRRERPGGPAAARNAALARIACGTVALLDSDCVPSPGWLSQPSGALAADPGLGAVAPRVRPFRETASPPAQDSCWEPSSSSGRTSFPAPTTASATAIARFASVRSPLDLGPWPSLVRPAGRIAYVPTAALLARREALGETGTVFDPALRYGEDVDLVWRMLDRGWSVRYEPTSAVGHGEPSRLWPWLVRRFRYGSSAGPLAQRHPERLAPVALHPRSVAVLAAATAAASRRRPGVPAAGVPVAGVPAAGLPVAGLAVALHVGVAVRSLSRRGVPRRTAAALALRGLGETGAALGRTATMLGPEPLALALAHPRGRRAVKWLAARPPVRRAAVALLLASPVREQLRLRPPLDPVRFAAVSLADDVAYGAGVWAGALRAGTLRPLRPRIVR